jgi:hypothetical protein
MSTVVLIEAFYDIYGSSNLNFAWGRASLRPRPYRLQAVLAAAEVRFRKENLK